MGRRRVRSHWKRRRAAIKAWNTRIRREGLRKLFNTVLSTINLYNKLKTIKDITINTVKILKPEVYRKSRVLKYIDKKL